MADMSAILTALEAPDYINLLIMELKDEDVTESMYPVLSKAKQVKLT